MGVKFESFQQESAITLSSSTCNTAPTCDAIKIKTKAMVLETLNFDTKFIKSLEKTRYDRFDRDRRVEGCSFLFNSNL